MWNSLSNLLLGRSCAGCGLGSLPVCQRCYRALAGPPRLIRRDLTGFPTTLSSALYDDVSQRLIVEYKDRGRWSLAPSLAALLARSCARLLVDDVVGAVSLVPVPSRPQAVRARGEDVLVRLARSTAVHLRGFGVEATVCAALRQSAQTVDHVGLTRDDRWRTSYGTVRWTGKRPLVPAIIVDDVVTSGASLTESARACAAAGVVVLGAATLAARGWC